MWNVTRTPFRCQTQDEMCFSFSSLFTFVLCLIVPIIYWPEPRNNLTLSRHVTHATFLPLMVEKLEGMTGFRLRAPAVFNSVTNTHFLSSSSLEWTDRGFELTIPSRCLIDRNFFHWNPRWLGGKGGSLKIAIAYCHEYNIITDTKMRSWGTRI